MKTFMNLGFKLMMLALVITACSKDENENYSENPDPLGYLKFGAVTAQNGYGLICSISADKDTIVQGEDYTIHYSIENTLNDKFDKNVYISLDVICNKPDFPMGESMGDYYSLLWWVNTTWGRTTKSFELEGNNVLNDSVNIADIGWINYLSSAIQPDYPNFDELIESGALKFQLSVIIDDSNDNDPETAPTIIYSNILNLTIE